MLTKRGVGVILLILYLKNHMTEGFMASYITIDGGTTNTRISLVCDKEIKKTVKLKIGARASIDGNAPLKKGIKDAIDSLLAEFSLCESEIERILASGMITCEFGLCHLEHTYLPAGLAELKETSKEVTIEEISSIPFVFVRGLKKLKESILDTDMVRGEETELMGIINEGAECVYVLPGSHSKVIEVGKDGKIIDFSTHMTGEMIAALSENTILKDAVDLSCEELNEEYLMLGYDAAQKMGINAALFKTRILKNLFGRTKCEVYSYFLGTVLSREAEEIGKLSAGKIVIGGKAEIKEALSIILRNTTNKRIIPLSEEEVAESVTRGLIRIYEFPRAN